MKINVLSWLIWWSERDILDILDIGVGGSTACMHFSGFLKMGRKWRRKRKDAVERC